MKTLTEKEMIALLPPEADELDAAKRVMGRVTPPHFTPNWLDYGVAEGWFKVCSLHIGSERAFVVWYHKSPSGGLVINAVASLLAGDHSEALLAGVETLARHLGCRYVEFQTRRAGMVAKTQARGFRVESVTLRKDF